MPKERITTVADEIAQAAAAIADARCDDPESDAKRIVAAATGHETASLEARLANQVDASASATIAAYVRRRAAREPLAYILGECEFRGLRLRVDRRVLVPDDGAATLVELALSLPRGARLHDVGTGSGAIALAAKHERPDLIVTGSDISAGAIDVARLNAASLKLEVHFSVAPGLPAGDFDLVIANLPYLEDGARSLTDERGQAVAIGPEYTEYMPDVAVFGGARGLEVVESFLGTVPSGTRVVLEHAPAQSPAIQSFLADASTFTGQNTPRRFTVGNRR